MPGDYFLWNQKRKGQSLSVKAIQKKMERYARAAGEAVRVLVIPERVVNEDICPRYDAAVVARLVKERRGAERDHQVWALALKYAWQDSGLLGRARRRFRFIHQVLNAPDLDRRIVELEDRARGEVLPQVFFGSFRTVEELRVFEPWWAGLLVQQYAEEGGPPPTPYSQ